MPGEKFNNVIFTDECSIQTESHRCFCCRKKRWATKKQAKTQAPTETPHTYGQELVFKVLQQCAYLKAGQMLCCSCKFWTKLRYHSPERCSQRVTVLCKIMIRNIVQSLMKRSSRIMESTGGTLPPSWISQPKSHRESLARTERVHRMGSETKDKGRSGQWNFAVLGYSRFYEV